MEQNNPTTDISNITKMLSKHASRCAKFIGLDSPIKIQTTNAQQLFNHYQSNFRDHILVLDFRSQKEFEKYHISGSLNVPLDVCSPSDFINFSEAAFSRKYCLNKQQLHSFKLRKRSFVILIPFETKWDDLIERMPSLFNKDHLEAIPEAEITEDYLSVRNSLLCKKILVKERHRDAYLCKTGMQEIAEKYPFLCRFKNSVPKTAKEGTIYPSEIFEDCLYLGNCKHAKDERILQSLGITHILNVSDTVPNYFEDDSHFKIEYSNIEIEDVEDAPICSSFEHAFNYIDYVLNDSENILTSQEKSVEEENQVYEQMNEFSSHYKGEFDTQTLKLDLSTMTVENWSTCKDKTMISFCDLHISNMHKETPKNKILVHCAMGKSRSATIVTMYIMKKFMLPYQLAVDMVKERREKIQINSGFISQLQEFETDGFKFPAEISDRGSESTEGEENILSSTC